MKIAELKPVGQPRQGRLVRFSLYFVIGLILIVLPIFLPMYLQGLMTKILVFAIFAISLDLIWGYTGLSSMGHAAFFGIAGYATAILIRHYGAVTFLETAPLSILITTVFAAVFGIISLRVSGLYFLMVTLALGQALFSIAWEWYHVTGGAFGLTIPPLKLGIPGVTSTSISIYYFVFILFIICYFLLRLIVKSPFGHVLQGIRENEPRMRALGYNTWLYKYIAFIIAGFFAGISGILFVHWNMLISPYQLGMIQSTYAVLCVILGGPGTLIGPVIGAAVVIGLEYGASIYNPERWPLFLGIIFVISVMFLRGGVYPRLNNLWKKVVEKYSYGSIKS